MKRKQNLIVTGSSGRTGRLIRLSAKTPEYADFSIDFTERRSLVPALTWDMMGTKVPAIPEGGILLHLAATLPGRGSGADLADNIAMAHAILRADQAAPFAHVVFMSTVAVYAPDPSAISETTPANPQNDYGKSKLQAEQILSQGLSGRLTVLRLANLAGADALLGGSAAGTPSVLDPVPGQTGGPLRSYIGPMTLAATLGALLTRLANGGTLPPILNLAQPGLIAMADLLDVSGREWSFGPYRPQVIPKMEVDVTRLTALCPLPPVSASQLIAELASLRGLWP